MANQIFSRLEEYRSRSLAHASVPLVVGAAAFLALVSMKMIIDSVKPKATSGSHQHSNRGRLCDVAIQSTGEVTKEPDFPEVQKAVGLAHISIYDKPRSYHRVDHLAGYPLFLILGRDHVLREFHNVCRHRAYPVVSTKSTGCAYALGCKYHGWSYDLKGNLIKAPKFEHLENFDKKANSLLEVNVQVADDGTILVDVGTAAEKPARQHKSQASKLPQGMWEIEGPFNWKLAEAQGPPFSLPATIRDNINAQSAQSALFNSVFSRGWLPRHSKPSILSDIINAPEHDMAIVLQVYHISAERSKLKVSLHTSSSGPPAQMLINNIKHDTSQAILRLENVYSVVKTSFAVPGAAHHLTMLVLLKSHQRLERLSGRSIWPASELITQASNDASTEAEKLYQELENVDANREDNNHKESEPASDIAWRAKTCIDYL